MTFLTTNISYAALLFLVIGAGSTRGGIGDDETMQNINKQRGTAIHG